MKPRVLLSWSSGKDCAWALHVMRTRGDVDVVGLMTTVNEAFNRVAMHAVRRSLIEQQAQAAGLPLRTVELPWPCTNEIYEARVARAIQQALADGITHMAFGDLFLEDVRAYRVRQLAGTGIEPMFPVWGTAADTPSLARTMVASGLRAIVTCVDPAQIAEQFVGRTFDSRFLDDLPPGVDPCGEQGEFHTFCVAGPMFAREIPVRRGEVVTREGFTFADLLPVGPEELVASREQPPAS